MKGKREGEITPSDAEFQRTARRDRKAFLTEQYKLIEESNRIGKTRDLFEKNIEIPRERQRYHFMQRWAQ